MADVEIFGRVKGKTELAILLYDGVITDWLPRSQIAVESHTDGMVRVTMPEWLAEQKGFLKV